MEQLRYKLRGVFADTPARDTTEDFCGSVLQRLQADYAAGTFRSTLVQYHMWALDILRIGTWDFWSFARGRGRSWGCSLLEQCTMFRTVRAAADSCEFDVEEACAALGVECAHGFVPEAGVSISPALSEAVTQVIVTWGLDPVQRLTSPSAKEVEHLMTVVLQVCKCPKCFETMLEKSLPKIRHQDTVAIFPAAVQVLWSWTDDFHAFAGVWVQYLVRLYQQNQTRPVLASEIDSALVAVCNHAPFTVIDDVVRQLDVHVLTAKEGRQLPAFMGAFRTRKAILEERWSPARVAWCAVLTC